MEKPNYIASTLKRSSHSNTHEKRYLSILKFNRKLMCRYKTQ